MADDAKHPEKPTCNEIFDSVFGPFETHLFKSVVLRMISETFGNDQTLESESHHND